MDVRPGYKLTEVGVIPEEWEVTTVGAEFAVQLGKMLDSERNTGELKPYLGNRAVQWSRIDIHDLPLVPMSQSDLEKFRLRTGDVLVCEGGEVGRAAIWEAPLEECYYQKALHRLRARRGYRAHLIVAMLEKHARSGFLSNFVTQTSIAHLPRDKFLTVPIPRPSDIEQDAIVGALYDADELLNSLDRLIAKKCDLKQAAMQQLLTGQTRLPGFHGEWELVALGEIAVVRNEKVLSSSMPSETPCVELESIEAEGTGRLLSLTQAGGSSVKYAFKAGDVLFGRLRAYLRKYWLASLDGVCSTEIWPIIPRSRRLHSSFLYLVVQTEAFIRAAGVSYGTHMPRSDWSVLAEVPVHLPHVDEQVEIARVLTDMDAEIAALEARRDKTRALKEAMMQELLTGRTRLV